MTKSAPRIFAGLSDGELAELSDQFRVARRDCRAVMAANWNKADVTETYRRMVVDFQNDDPLFSS